MPRQDRKDVIAWVGSNILPYEAGLRAHLRGLAIPEDEIGDIVQDAYVRLSKLDSITHIRNGRSYFFATARSILLDRVRHERIVRIDSMFEIEALAIADDAPSADRQLSSRQELARVRALIDGLPARCREIFELRRVQGIPQREIAQRLGLPEHTIEAQAVRGLKLILKALAEEDTPVPSRTIKKGTESDVQRRH